MPGRPRLLSLPLVLAVAAAAAAQPGAFGPGGGPIEQQPRWRLLNAAPVQADLKLNADQKGKLKGIPAAVRAKSQAQADALKTKTDANVSARKKMLAELEKATDEAVGAVLAPKQVARLRQVHVQTAGLGAFEMPSVKAALKLSDAQQADVRKLAPEWQAAFQKAEQDAQKQAGGDQAKLRRLVEAKFEELGRDFTRRAVLLLNAEQRRTWEALTGPAATLAPPEGPPVAPVLANLRVLLDPDPQLVSFDPNDLLDHPGLGPALGLGKEEAARLAAVPAALAKRFQAQAQKLQDEAQALQLELLTLEVQQAEEARGRAMKDVLTPEQAKRLTEIELQARGLWAFGEAEVVKALKLTPEQAEAIELAGDRVAHQAQQPQPSSDVMKWETEVGKVVGPPMRDGLAAVMATLSAEQKKAWRELAGETFDFAKVTEPAPYVDVVLSGPASPALRCALRGSGLTQQRKWAEARAELEEGARLGPKNAEALNGLAYFLATCPEDKQRDGKRALALAKKALELAGDRDPNHLDTLAAAHAEVGDFAEALKAQTRALELAPPFLKESLEAKLKLLREKKPIRQ